MPKPIKLQAAARLKVMAKADEAMARRYIKHVTGFEPGEVKVDDPDRMTFSVSDHITFRKMLDKLNATLPRAPLTRSSSAYVFYADESKTRLIIMLAGVGHQGWVGTVALVDKNHAEDYLTRVRRLLK